MANDMDFCQFKKSLQKYGKQLLDTAAKIVLDALKTASKKQFTRQLKQQVNLQQTKL